MGRKKKKRENRFSSRTEAQDNINVCSFALVLVSLGVFILAYLHISNSMDFGSFVMMIMTD